MKRMFGWLLAFAVIGACADRTANVTAPVQLNTPPPNLTEITDLQPTYARRCNPVPQADWLTIRVDPATSGTYTGPDGSTVDVTVKYHTVSWTFNGVTSAGVDVFVVKVGYGWEVVDFRPGEATSYSITTAYAPSHLLFCYDPDPGTLVWEKRIESATGSLLGGATFKACRTHDSSGALLTPAECIDPIVDNSPPDADPTDGRFQLNNLALGTWEVTETAAPPGFTLSATPQSVVLSSGSPSNATSPLVFVNFCTNCVGLTPGYWSNWRNHYTDAQFTSLLQGTIANSIAQADAILVSVGCDGDDGALACMRRFLLSNQLTLNLTQNPQLPNPSGGDLKAACELAGNPNNLGDWLNQALAIHNANGVGFTRDYILQVNSVLDAFANLN